LGPLFALLNNIIEIRTDAYKLCTSYQRPPGQMAQDIGSWESVLQALAATAVITNAFIVAFTSSWVEDRIVEHVGAENLTAGRLFIVLIFEVKLNFFIFYYFFFLKKKKIKISMLFLD